MYFVKFDPKLILSDLMHLDCFQVKAALNDQMNSIIIYLIYNKERYILTNIPVEAINTDFISETNVSNFGTIDGDISCLELYIDEIDGDIYEELLDKFDEAHIFYMCSHITT